MAASGAIFSASRPAVKPDAWQPVQTLTKTSIVMKKLFIPLVLVLGTLASEVKAQVVVVKPAVRRAVVVRPPVRVVTVTRAPRIVVAPRNVVVTSSPVVVVKPARVVVVPPPTAIVVRRKVVVL